MPHIVHHIRWILACGICFAALRVQHAPDATRIQSVGRETGVVAIVIDLISPNGPFHIEEDPKILGGMQCTTLFVR